MFDAEGLRSWLSSYGVKKMYLAKLLGVHPCTIATWLSGKFQPTPEHVKRLETIQRQYEAMMRTKGKR